MKRIALFLSLLLLLPLASCAVSPEITNETGITKTNENETESLTQEETVSTEEILFTEEETVEEPDTYDYPFIQDKITWDDINAFPIANSSMSTDELRKLCVDFFRFSKSFAWTPNGDWEFQKNAKGSMDKLEQGTIYGGLPYVGLGSGSVYRTMDYYDPETGVLDIKKAGKDRFLFGNQCSIGAYWGWGRVVNSAKYQWTYDAVEKNGFIRVGPYTYGDRDQFTKFQTTSHVVKNNGEQTMFESYALLQPGDGLVYYTSAGHIIMCSAAAVVVRNEDGTINGDESYILKIDQGQSWKDYPQSNGDSRSVKAGIDTKSTFSKLFKSNYVPFTFAEFLGTDPVEDAVCTFSFQGNSISPSDLQKAKVTANYGISDIYLIAKDKNGKELYKLPVRTTTAGNMEMDLKDSIIPSVWKKLANSENKLEVVVQLSNGTRPVIYEGILTK